MTPLGRVFPAVKLRKRPLVPLKRRSSAAQAPASFMREISTEPTVLPPCV